MKNDFYFGTTNNELKNLYFDSNGMIELNIMNYNKIENMIKNPCVNIDNINMQDDEFYSIVKKINAFNHTRVSDDCIRSAVCSKQGIELIIKGMLEDGYDCVEELDNAVVSIKNKHIRSLSSKIFKYLDLWINKEENRFVVNDSIVRSVLPYYLETNGIKDYRNDYTNKGVFGDDVSYDVLVESVCKLQEKTCDMTKHKIDQIIWYCYKDNQLSIEYAKAFVRNIIKVVN